jgi:hypothetical protein
VRSRARPPLTAQELLIQVGKIHPAQDILCRVLSGPIPDHLIAHHQNARRDQKKCGCDDDRGNLPLVLNSLSKWGGNVRPMLSDLSSTNGRMA